MPGNLATADRHVNDISGNIEIIWRCCRPRDGREAYDIQDALHGVLGAAGLGQVAGYKIGCTTPVMQRFMKIDHPCAVGVFASTARHHAGRFRFGDFCRVSRSNVAALVRVRLFGQAAPWWCAVVVRYVRRVRT
jgi:hypothetical protein